MSMTTEDGGPLEPEADERPISATSAWHLARGSRDALYRRSANQSPRPALAAQLVPARTEGWMEPCEVIVRGPRGVLALVGLRDRICAAAQLKTE